jgi:hypothetical protein
VGLPRRSYHRGPAHQDIMVQSTELEKHDTPGEIEFADRQSIRDGAKVDPHLDLLLKSDLDRLSGWQTAWRFRKVPAPLSRF